MLKDLVEQVTATTGTGAYTVSGSVAGRRTFADAFTTGDAYIPYVVTDGAGGFECGLGAWTEGTSQLARTVVMASSNADAAVDWAAGDKRIYVSLHAGVGGLQSLRHNLNGAADPTVNDDATDGYDRGSLWATPSTGKFFLCASATAGAASWRELPLLLTSGGLDGLTVGGTAEVAGVRIDYDVPRIMIGGPNNWHIIPGWMATALYDSGSSSFADGASGVMAALTTDATATKLAFRGDHATNFGLWAEANSINAVEGLVVAQQNGGSDRKAWKVTGTFTVDGAGAVTEVGTSTYTELYESAGATGWTVAFATATNDIALQATGEAAKTIVWSFVPTVAQAGHY